MPVAQEAALCPWGCSVSVDPALSVGLLCVHGSVARTGAGSAAAPAQAPALCAEFCLVSTKNVWVKCRLQACFELSFQFCGCDGWGCISAFIVCKFSFV